MDVWFQYIFVDLCQQLGYVVFVVLWVFFQCGILEYFLNVIVFEQCQVQWDFWDFVGGKINNYKLVFLGGCVQCFFGQIVVYWVVDNIDVCIIGQFF